MTPGTTAVNLPHVPSTIRDIPAPLTPEQIGARAKEAAPDRYGSYHLSLLARKVEFDTLASLLRHIGNASSHTCVDPNLRIKNSDLVVKLGPSNYQPLIKNFRLKSDKLGNVDALSALRITGLPVRASASERFLCALSTVGNVLIGRGAGHARSEHLSLDLHTLRKKVADRVDDLRLDGCTDGTSACLETQFFNGKHAKELEDIRLTGMDLSSCDLTHTSLKGKNLARCNLPMDMTGVDLREATLYDVSFGHERRLPEKVIISRKYFESWGDSIEKALSHGRSLGKFYPDFSGVQMQGAKLTLPSPFHAGGDDKAEVLDLGYNHLNNNSSGSILKSIHSIGDLTLKKELMETCMADLLAHTSRQERASISRPLTDILFNSDYLSSASKNSSVRKVVDEIIEDHFANGDERLLDLSSFFCIDLGVFLKENLRHALSLTEKSALEAAPTAFCQQLVQACTPADDSDYLHDDALKVQRRIFSLPAHAEAVKMMQFARGDTEDDPTRLGEIAVFSGADGYSAAMSDHYYQTFIQGTAREESIVANPEVDIVLFENNKRIDNSNLSNHIDNIPFLRSFLGPQLIRSDIETKLGLTLHHHYKALFNDACNVYTFDSRKLTDRESKNELAALVDPHLTRKCFDLDRMLEKEVNVTEDYIRNVLIDNQMNDLSQNEQGYFLLCLSAIFTKLSSSHQFGTELDSPEPLRYLAAGLLKAASERLPPNTLTALDTSFEGEITTFEDRLLGNDGAFTCTAVAYDMIKPFLNELSKTNRLFLSIYKKTLPPRWF